MGKYKYINPVEQGFSQFSLTKKQHNALFKFRKYKWLDRYEYYYNEQQVILHKFINWKGVLIITLTSPIMVLLHGITNVKEIWNEIIELYNQKETGSFVSDHVRGDKYEEIMKLIDSPYEKK